MFLGRYCRYNCQLCSIIFDLAKECNRMGKAILAMIVTIIVGFMSRAIFANWVNAPEWGVILAVAVMGAFIIGFNDKKK